MNNEIAPVLDMLEELKQDCKAISKAQVELRTTIGEQLSNAICQHAISRARSVTVSLRTGHGQLLVLRYGSQQAANSRRLRPTLPLSAYKRQSNRFRFRPSRQHIYNTSQSQSYSPVDEEGH